MKQVRSLVERLRPVVEAHRRRVELTVRLVLVVGVTAALTRAVWGQRDAIAGFDWSLSWQLFLLAVLAFSVAPFAQAFSFWMILRFLTGTTPFGEAMVIWARSYLVRYVPSGALELVLRISQRQRLHATRGQVLLASGYEHLGALAAGACACTAAFAAAGGVPPVAGIAVAAPTLAVAVALRPGFAGNYICAFVRRRGLDVPRILRGREIASVVAVNATAWLATSAAVYILVEGLTDSGAPGIAWLASAYAFGYLVGFITPFLPGGLGAREGAVVTVLVSRYSVGVATALALAIRLANTLGELLAVAILELGYLTWRRRDSAPASGRTRLAGTPAWRLREPIVTRRQAPLRRPA